jgi:hypothetical protein
MMRGAILRWSGRQGGPYRDLMGSVASVPLLAVRRWVAVLNGMIPRQIEEAI